MKTVINKSFAGVAVSVLLVSVYVITGVLIFANKLDNDINISNLNETAAVLKNFTPASVFIDRSVAAEWSSRFSGLTAENSGSPYRVTLISRNGEVIFDTGADSQGMENHLDRPEIQEAIKNGTGSAQRRSATLGQYYIYSAIAIKGSANEFAGVLRLSLLVPGFFSRLVHSALPFLIGGFVIIIAVCAGLYRFSRRLSLSVEEQLNTELIRKTAELKVKSEEAEAESRHRGVILNNMFEGIITLDRDLNIILANSHLCILFGFEETEGLL